MTIKLSDVWVIPNLENYKLHFARWNTIENPLDVWARDRREWQGWNEYKPARNEFNRKYIFSLIQFYHETDTWLFGGIFEVLQRHEKRYEIVLTGQGRGHVGRLKVVSSYRERATRVNFENHFPELVVKEILPQPYSGIVFPGFEGIELSFSELEVLVKIDRLDWKTALCNVKGIYLITDTNTGKRYVGSAYGVEGIWSRWTSYIENGHGGNVELKVLANDPDLNYWLKFFRIALLEHRSVQTSDETIISRESYWKRVLLTRGDGGLNRN
jgi:hypothetical protein